MSAFWRIADIAHSAFYEDTPSRRPSSARRSTLDGYHYSYPPVMLLLTAPFALIPYVPALFVWLSASWYAFYCALKLAMPGRGVLLLALVAAALAHLTGIAFGPLFILPLFIVALQMSFGARGAAVSASSSRLSSAQP
jgi:hypothetical protein